MEILGRNRLLDSDASMSSSIVPGGAFATNTSYNAADRDVRFPYVAFVNTSSGSTFWKVQFSAAKNISRMALLNHNMKRFSLQYVGGGFTQNFSLTTTSGTTASQWTTNSQTSHYLSFATVAATSVLLACYETNDGETQAQVGYIAIADAILTMSQKPGYSGYSLINKDKSISHEMANGGYRYQTLAQKFSAKLDMEYVPATLRASLYNLYYNRQEMLFVPNQPTTTASTWDQQIFPCVWSNGFDFETYSDNCATPYYSGSIELDEVSK